MRTLVDRTGPERGRPLSDTDLADLYAVPRTPWLRANMVLTVGGSSTGPDGLSGTINNAADARVFHLLRRMADAILVGAETARAERYGAAARPLVVVSKSGDLPPTLAGAGDASLIVATCSGSTRLAALRRKLGEANVLVSGADAVDLARLIDQLHARGFTNLLCEGGPQLLSSLLSARLVDELCVTSVPRLVGPATPMITKTLDLRLRLRALLEEDGTLLARWWVDRSDHPNVPSLRAARSS